MESFLKGYSIEVMPHCQKKIEDFRALLLKGTRLHRLIEGTPIEDMVATAKRIANEGYGGFLLSRAHHQVRDTDWIAQYRVRQALNKRCCWQVV